MKINSRYDFPKLIDFHNLPRIMAEVGVAGGEWALTMFEWGIDKLYLIDVWSKIPFLPGCASFSQEWHDGNYKRVQELFSDKPNVEILKGFSYQMADEIPDGSLGFVYIDGDHSYNGVKADLETFWPKIVPGGIIGLHDFANPDYGVYRAVKEFSLEKNTAINTLFEDGDIVNIGCWIRK